MSAPAPNYALIATSLVRAFLTADTRAIFDTIKGTPNPEQLAFTLAQGLAGTYYSDAREHGGDLAEITARAVGMVDSELELLLGAVPDAPEDVAPAE